MSITVNDGGTLRTLSTITVNDAGTLRTLSIVKTNDGDALRTIYKRYSFDNTQFSEVVWGGGMEDGYTVTKTAYNGLGFAFVEIKGKSVAADEGMRVNIFFPFITAGDTVTMSCKWYRKAKGFYITATHVDETSTKITTVTNGAAYHALTAAEGSYYVTYTAPTDGGGVALDYILCRDSDDYIDYYVAVTVNGTAVT